MGVLDVLKDTLSYTKNTIAGGVSKLASEAADTAADVALAPLSLIEKQLKSIANLGPGIVENRRNAINKMLTGIEANALKYDEQAAISERSQAVTTIERRVAEIKSDSSVPDDIKNMYKDIDVKNMDISPDKLLDALANADDALLVFEEKEFDIVRLIKRAWRISSDYIYRILFLFAMIFGGTILSNVYIHEEFWAIRFYYFVYGVIFFPFALIYGAVNPPAWNATIFPMYKNTMRKEVVPSIDDVAPLQAFTSPIEQEGGANTAHTSPITHTPAHTPITGVSGPGAFVTGPTLTERFNLIVMSLFGYKYETDTMTMRVLSIVLAGSLSTWAFYKGDLNHFLYYAKKMYAKKV